LIELAAAARSTYALELLERLVAEPSVEGSAAVSACLDIVEAEIASVATDRQRPSFDGLESLIARFGSGSPERRLILAGHVDVVPAGDGWSSHPFQASRQGDRIVGRGTSDMKSGVAAFVAAIRALADARLLDNCALELVLTGDEEVGSDRGMVALIEGGLLQGQVAVCGEPTALHLFLGNRGLVWLLVRIHGRGGHAGQVHTLANPVPVAARLALALEDMPLKMVDERFDPPTPSLTVTRLQAGTDLPVNVVPGIAEVALDRRLLPGEDQSAAVEQIRGVVAKTVAPPFSGEVEVIKSWPPCVISADEEIARRALESLNAAGRQPRVGMDSAANDASWLSQAGVPTILLGPGTPKCAHTVDEYVPIKHVTDAVAIYAQLALTIAEAVP
jgi:acetylornithine deacetylase/succinyl-diaminopimelate desuccinylase-like protein